MSQLCDNFQHSHMRVSIFSEHDELLQQTVSEPAQYPGPELQESNYATDQPFWKDRVKEISLNGLHAASHQLNVLQQVHIRSEDTRPLPGMLFVRQGHLETRTRDRKEVWAFSAQQHNLLHNAYNAETTTMERQEQLTLFVLSIEPQRFAQLAEGGGRLMETMMENMEKGNTFSLAGTGNGIITPAMNQVLDALVNCAYTGTARKLFLESKMLELLALQCEQMESPQTKNKAVRLNSTDISRLHQVKELLLNDIAATPTLAGLARAAGLNEFKLKAGFKALFQQTVFGFLSDHRLQQAREQVQQSEKSLTEIAFETGFASIYHFSAAFKNKFGISPIHYRR